MLDPVSRRDWLKTMGAAGAGAMLPVSPVPGFHDADPTGVRAPVLPLTSTSDVFVPPRGRAFDKFSFDFPEPSVEFEGLWFGFLVFTRENVYGLDAGAMSATRTDDALTIDAAGLVWAGGQERAAGRLRAQVRRVGDAIEWDVTVELPQPIKAVTTVLRGVPRGRLSSGGGEPFDPKDDEVLYGYPFGGGDLFGGNTAWGMGTPLVAVQAADQRMLALVLDIAGGWVNNPAADMHEGTRRLVADLRARYPQVLACGEFHYDALLEFIPLYHVYSPHGVPYARYFSHLSHPAPGRGSSGVHESGFSTWEPATLSLSKRPGLIPTLNVVDDTFTKYRDQMAAVIARAKEWA